EPTAEPTAAPTVTPDPTATPEPPAAPTATPEPAEGTYVLVTDLNEITSGDYVVYGVRESYTGAMGNTVASGRVAAVPVTLSGNTVVDPEAAVIWHFEEQSDGSFTLYNAAAGKYLKVAGSNTSGMSLTDTAEYGFTVEESTGSANTWFIRTTESNHRVFCIYTNSFRTYDPANFYYDTYLYKFVSGEQPVCHTVNFYDWDGTLLSTQQVEDGAAAAAPADPSREGYTFMGWSVVFSNVTGDLDVYATYSINTYTVTFKDWDGTVLKTQTVNYGGAATAPADPTREGYTFIGWDKAFNNVTSNLVVNALYEENAQPGGLLGDVNCDGYITSADISALFAYIMNAGSLTDQGVLNADLNGDGVITSADVTVLAQLIFG
ncbi:MAG: InlB B-repeat-containing protein, partial [Clostridia bacterium]|nr:InlB B-repeat-containing protein [Clostridia bacterium]